MSHSGLPRVLVVAGEASADHHAAAVLRELRSLVGPVDARGLGGGALARAGLVLEQDLRRTTAMGGVEVLGRLPRIVSCFGRLLWLARRWRPQVALLVDLPDFNLPLGRRLRQLGIPVQGYVAPQYWAWRPGRLRAVAESVDGLSCVLPFEAEPLRRAGARATFVGHPLLDEVPLDRSEARQRLGLGDTALGLALLPGSRPGELAHHLAPMLTAAERLRRRFGTLRVLWPVPESLEQVPSVPDWVEVTRTSGSVPAGRLVLAASDAAVVASGTATLEAALAEVAHVIVYRFGWATSAAARLLVRCRFIGLSNLVLGRRAFPELTQSQVTADGLCSYGERLLREAPERAAQRARWARELRERLQGPGAARTTALFVARMLRP